MGKLFAIAGRPGSGKTKYLHNMKSLLNEKMFLTSAIDYSTFESMMQELSSCIMENDTCQCIAIDCFEESLIEQWEKVNYWKYKRSLNILAGLAESFDVDIYIAVGLKRQADKESSIYCSYNNLRSKAILEETDGVFFLKADYYL